MKTVKNRDNLCIDTGFGAEFFQTDHVQAAYQLLTLRWGDYDSLEIDDDHYPYWGGPRPRVDPDPSPQIDRIGQLLREQRVLDRVRRNGWIVT